jgi:hypothetical protein
MEPSSQTLSPSNPLFITTHCVLCITHRGEEQHWAYEAPDVEWRRQPTSGRKTEGILGLMNFLSQFHKLRSKHTLLLIDSFRVPECFQTPTNISFSGLCCRLQNSTQLFPERAIETGDLKYINEEDGRISTIATRCSSSFSKVHLL